MMRRGKDEKIVGPLFPRLHVNDTEKGGPRAPPRNKMALYEQLSIPSQRFNSELASTLPLPLDNASTLVPSASSSQGKRSVFSPFYMPPPKPAHLTGKLHSRSSNGVNSNAMIPEFEQKSMKNAKYQTMNATGYLSSTPDNSFRPHDFSNSKKSCQKNLGDDDDVRVPTFVHQVIASCSNKDLHCMDMEKITSSSPTHLGHSTVTPGNSSLKTGAATGNLSLQNQNAHNEHPKRTGTMHPKSRQRVRIQSEENLKGSVASRESAKKPACYLSTRDMFLEPLKKHANGSKNQEHRSSPVDDFGSGGDSDQWLHQDYRAGSLQKNIACGDDVSVEPMMVEKRNISRVRSELCSQSLPRNTHRSYDEAENISEYREDNVNGSLQVRDVDRIDDISETSMMDSILGLEVSPDDVVGVIGQKHFWKARRAIVNQQRVFAVQVFELHRLIKVQRLIAGSPHMLLEDNCHLGKPLNVSPAKKLPSEYVIKSSPQIVRPKDDLQKPSQSTECASQNTAGKPTFPSLNNGIDRGLVSQHSGCGPYPENPPAAYMATDNNEGPWYFHPPPGNQWLVPIMSPSEGLVYKPYPGPCPPTAGFMAPVYGSCGPLSLPPVAGDFLNPAYGVPATHQQGIGVLPGAPPVGQTYFPPYGIPVMSPVISHSAVEQPSLLASAQPHGQDEQLPTGRVDLNKSYQSSCNYSNQEREAVGCIRKFKTSKDSELHRSTASSPCERAQGVGAGSVAEGRDVVPLCPMASAVQVSDQPPQPQSDQHSRVIKVVPHNPRSATASESAARIFWSIQKERQQYDSV